MTVSIALVANTSWFVFNFCSGLIQSMQREGYEVAVLAPSDEYSGRFKESGVKYVPISINSKGTNPLEDLALLRRFYRYFKRVRPDAVLMYTIKPNIYASIAAGMLNTPVINSVTGLGTLFIDTTPVTRLAKRMYKYAMRRSSTVFFLNNDDLKLFLNARMVNPLLAERIPGSGVDTNKFKPGERRLPNSEFTFLLSARMLWQKGVGEYAKAAKALKIKYPKARFQLLGFLDVENHSAVSRMQMERWVQEGIVEYLGVSDNVVEQLQAADCVVLPSYREGVPRSLLEAASCAKPIITTRSVGCQDVVDNDINGFLCEPRNAEDLADKMERMMNLSKEARLAMGQRGREKMVREFDERIVIDRYLVAIRQAVAPKTGHIIEPA